MRLEKFRIANFRNINDSGWVDVAGTTALVGRNESGKTNLLEALRTLSGPCAGEALSLTRDLPADRMRSEYSDDLEVVRTRWRLDEEERNELAALLPGGGSVSAVEVWRGYPPDLRVEFCGAGEGDTPLAARAKGIVAQLADVAILEVDSDSAPWAEALGRLEAAVVRAADEGGDWDRDVREALQTLDEAGRAGGISSLPEVRTAIAELEELVAQSGESSGSEAAATEWVLRKLPPFLYVDEYSDIDGHMDLRSLAQRRKDGLSEPSDRHYETLLRMAGIDEAALEEILEGDPEVRRQIVGRAGAGVTRKLRGLWTDRALKVRFNLDGDNLQTLVCDPNAIVDIEVNLNQRSSGFRWFFSFFIMLTASRQDPAMRDAVLLLDEPGLQLHAAGQRDLLRHLSAEIDNQSILATQSPFMIPIGDEAAVCTVCFEEEQGTTVTRDAEARDAGFAAHAEGSELGSAPSAGSVAAATDAVPGELLDALFGSGPALVVEQVSDFWYLNAISEYCAKEGREYLPDGLVQVPAGGAVWMPYVLGLLGKQPAHPILVLTSRAPDGLATAGEAPTAITPIFIGEAFPEPPSRIVELEDLVDPRVYHRFVRTAYREELEGKELDPDLSIESAVDRYEKAFAAIDLRFSRRGPARLAAGPSLRNLEAFLAKGACERFERLFQLIGDRLDAATS